MENLEKAVEVESWVKADSPVSLYTGGYGPCIAVAIYDPTVKPKCGYIWHSSFNIDELDEMLNDVVENTKDSKKVRIWVRGGGYETVMCDDFNIEDQRRMVDTFRKDTLDKLREYFPNQKMDVRFQDPNMLGSAILHTKNGKFESDEEESTDECYP